MLKPAHSLLGAAAYFAFIAAFAVSAPKPGVTQGQGNGQPVGPDVRVINKVTEPVPVKLQGSATVTGDVNVANTPTVKLFSGSKVGIDPAADGVTVKNDTSSPIPVAGTVRDGDQPARSPHQEGFGFAIANGITSEVSLSQVPAGKRLVIEYLSANGSVPTGQTGFFFVKTSAGGNASLHITPVTQKFSDDAIPGSDLLISAQPIRLYADPGTTPSVSFRRSSAAGGATFSAFISGYLVDL